MLKPELELEPSSHLLSGAQNWLLLQEKHQRFFTMRKLLSSAVQSRSCYYRLELLCVQGREANP